MRGSAVRRVGNGRVVLGVLSHIRGLVSFGSIRQGRWLLLPANPFGGGRWRGRTVSGKYYATLRRLRRG